MYRETSSVPLPSMFESSEISFLVLYNLTESALVDCTELHLGQLREEAVTETADKARQIKYSYAYL